MSDHMSPLDAAFLTLEDEQAEASLAISSTAVLEGPAPSPAEFRAAILARLPLVPRYRQKARTVPLDLGPPVWVDDPGFDLDYHLRRVALAPPGGDAALREAIADIMAQRLDRDHPLWEYWVIEGLADGRWALVSKVHHCMVDGVSGTQLYYAVFDESPEGARDLPPDTWAPGGEPSTVALTTAALHDLLLKPVEQARVIGQALATPSATAHHLTVAARGLATLTGALRPATVTTLTGPIGRHRRYATAHARLTDVKQIAHRAGVTFNDVVLAAISGGYRSLLRRRGEEPHPHAVRSLVPVSVRAPGEEGICENRISLMLADLPVHVTDPAERLRAVHRHLTELKASGEAQAGEAIIELAGHEPYPPVSWGMRLAAHLPQRQIVTVTTNVPGPRKPLYLLGRKALEILPYVPIATRLRTGVSIFTYCDRVTFGVTGDYDTAPDTGRLAQDIEQELQKLLLAYRPAPATPSRPRAVKPRKAVSRSAHARTAQRQPA
ncbi:wax ester/triacylglycerol synthase family O-acyltransferase [Nonomuraea sp. PA05]|uniref:WS/DGAT/MGAT family O-acyltransferase n=1 Tax=Nonomuraea sp. PA05 TaxID=2604466 RepID=UPI0011DA6BE4|nr:wax ester/triacylglycerol synthase family O-acyltransferase [Nonomuraea sp. PA05]TYB60219.1 wax ester/triacylglycerol synthase family O-acyltransferase [Nonomuraea sp. PA05]